MIWNEELIRREIIRLDQKTHLNGASLAIRFMNSSHTLGIYCGRIGEFRFSTRYFGDPEWPERCALDCIRHEYAHYDNSVLTLDDVSLSPSLSGQFTYKKLAVWLSPTDVSGDIDLLDLTFTIKDTAPSGMTPVSVSYVPGNISNYLEEDVEFATQSGGVTVSCLHSGGLADCTHRAICTDCGESYGDFGNHRYSVIMIMPTCTEEGYELYECLICGERHTDSHVAPTAHALKHIHAVKATESSDGNIEYWVCMDCGKIFSDGDGVNEITYANTVIKYVPPRIPGDANGDGRVNVRDVLLVMKHLVGWTAKCDPNMVTFDMALADFDANGKVNSRDVIAILRSVAGK